MIQSRTRRTAFGEADVILGQIGFLESFTVTFGPERFAVEPADVFNARFGDGR